MTVYIFYILHRKKLVKDNPIIHHCSHKCNHSFLSKQITQNSIPFVLVFLSIILPCYSFRTYNCDSELKSLLYFFQTGQNKSIIVITPNMYISIGNCSQRNNWYGFPDLKKHSSVVLYLLKKMVAFVQNFTRGNYVSINIKVFLKIIWI